MHPILLQIGIFTLYTTWLFVILATLCGTYIFLRLTVSNRLKIQLISDHSWKIILWGLVGARIFAIIDHFNLYFNNLSLNSFYQLFFIWDQKLSIWGAFAAIFLYFYFKISKIENNFPKWIDTLTPAIIVGLTISHIGSFFQGSNYGHETSLPWGVNFENPAVKYAVPIHPTQIYAFLYSAAITILLIYLHRTRKLSDKPGTLGLIGIFAISFLRFLEEFFRGDDVIMLFQIRTTQILAAIIFIISSIFLYKQFKK